jgi:hypothetical protein
LPLSQRFLIPDINPSHAQIRIGEWRASTLVSVHLPRKAQEEKIMQFKFTNYDDLLIIKLSGTPSPNERLLSKRSLVSHLQKSHLKVIVNLSDLREHGGAYLMGMLNMIRKEVQILWGETKLCLLSPRLYRPEGILMESPSGWVH